MSTPRIIGEARSYDELMGVLRARSAGLKLRMEDIDEAMKTLPDGYASKLLAPVPIRAMGPVSLGPMLAALGLKMVFVVDDQMLNRLARSHRKRGPNRKDAHAGMLTLKRKKRRGFWRGNKQWGAVLTARRVLMLPDKKRSEIARKAARARWRGKRPIEPATLA